MALNQLPFNQQPPQVFVKLWKQETGASITSWFDLCIKLRVRLKHRWFVQQEDGLTVMLKEVVALPTLRNFWVNSGVFFHPITSIPFVTQMLGQVSIHGHSQGALLHQISSFGNKMVSNAGHGRTMMSMFVDISVVVAHLFDERAAMTQALQVSMDEGTGSGVIPASESAIAQLQSVKFDNGDSDSIKEDCTICLEELTVGLVTALPCNHLFHRECITRWLETSSRCPLCRFQMPV